jgi:hypothetical protein
VNNQVDAQSFLLSKSKTFKKYRTPSLQSFGKVADLTQSGSIDNESDGVHDCDPLPGNMGKNCVVPPKP